MLNPCWLCRTKLSRCILKNINLTDVFGFFFNENLYESHKTKKSNFKLNLKHTVIRLNKQTVCNTGQSIGVFFCPWVPLTLGVLGESLAVCLYPERLRQHDDLLMVSPKHSPPFGQHGGWSSSDASCMDTLSQLQHFIEL